MRAPRNLTGFRQEEVYGIRAAAPLDVVLPIIAARVERVRDVLQGVVATRLTARGIAYLQGTARLGADRTVRVTARPTDWPARSPDRWQS